MECRSILIVDNDKDIRDSLDVALKVKGYIVHTASNDKDALDLLGNLPQDSVPGCIILDLAVPIINGPEFLKHIETNYKDEFGEIPILVTSANLKYIEPSKIGHESFKRGNPTCFDELLRAVEHHCGEP